jgi:predicted nucleic acid-binding protein
MFQIYLDNCCYGRPFDDLSQKKIKDEATAKMFIQSLVKYRSLILYSSFILMHEINDIPLTSNKEHIIKFVIEYSSFFIGENREKDIKPISEAIMKTGIKKIDAVHLACAIIAECDYFITTDKRVLNYKTDVLKIVNPIEFVEIWRKTI